MILSRNVLLLLCVLEKCICYKNQMSLMTKVYTQCNNSNLNELYLNDNSSTYTKNIRLTIREELTSHRYNLIRNNTKLKFYSTFKNDCQTSDCLNIITNINNKKTLNKFRLSNHRLQIFEFAPSAT